MCLLIDNMCHRKRNDYKIDMAIDTFWHESIVHKIGKVLMNSSKNNFTTQTLRILIIPSEITQIHTRKKKTSVKQRSFSTKSYLEINIIPVLLQS